MRRFHWSRGSIGSSTAPVSSWNVRGYACGPDPTVDGIGVTSHSADVRRAALLRVLLHALSLLFCYYHTHCGDCCYYTLYLKQSVVVLVLLRLVHLKENNRLCLFVTIICFSRRRVETLSGRRDFPISFERFDDLTVKTQVTRWLGWCFGGRMMHSFFYVSAFFC